MSDPRSEIIGEGQTPELIIDHFWIDPTLRERSHRADKVLSIADDPGRTHDVVVRHGADDRVTRRLRLPIDA